MSAIDMHQAGMAAMAGVVFIIPRWFDVDDFVPLCIMHQVPYLMRQCGPGTKAVVEVEPQTCDTEQGRDPHPEVGRQCM